MVQVVGQPATSKMVMPFVLEFYWRYYSGAHNLLGRRRGPAGALSLVESKMPPPGEHGN